MLCARPEQRLAYKSYTNPNAQQNDSTANETSRCKSLCNASRYYKACCQTATNILTLFKKHAFPKGGETHPPTQCRYIYNSWVPWCRHVESCSDLLDRHTFYFITGEQIPKNISHWMQWCRVKWSFSSSIYQPIIHLLNDSVCKTSARFCKTYILHKIKKH